MLQCWHSLRRQIHSHALAFASIENVQTNPFSGPVFIVGKYALWKNGTVENLRLDGKEDKVHRFHLETQIWALMRITKVHKEAPS